MLGVNHNSALVEENVLRFNTARFKKLYNIKITMENGPEIMIIQYNAQVEAIDQLPLGGYLAEVTITNFKVNGFEPDLIMEQLAHKCRKSLERVIFIVTENGEIAGIYNHVDLIQGWSKVKERLEMEYTGEIFKKYIALHEQVLLKVDSLMEALKQDIFVKQFFIPLYNKAFTNFQRKYSENMRVFNINYCIDMLLTLKDEVSPGGNMVITKSINRQDYDDAAMPVKNYATEYILDQKMEITGIYGIFENNGRKYNFNIAEKYGSY